MSHEGMFNLPIRTRDDVRAIKRRIETMYPETARELKGELVDLSKAVEDKLKQAEQQRDG